MKTTEKVANLLNKYGANPSIDYMKFVAEKCRVSIATVRAIRDDLRLAKYIANLAETLPGGRR